MTGLNTYNAIVKYVFDGDTLEVDLDLGFNHWIRGMVLRLHRVDAPEVLSKDEEEKKVGRVVKNQVMERVLNKEVVIKTFKDKKGKYDRWLAEVYFFEKNGDEVCLNDVLLKEGIVKEFVRQRPQERIS